MEIRHLLYGLLLLVTCLVQAELVEIATERDCTLVQKHLPAEFVLNSLTCKADVGFSKEEFVYLMDLPVDSAISSAALSNALARLFQKRLFEKMSVSIEDEGIGKAIHVNLVGLWTFQKFKVSGIWVGRDRFKQYYLMEPGDLFDADKHTHAMRKIKQMCAREGFFNTQIASTFTRDARTKSVVAKSAVKRANRFRMKEVVLRINGEGINEDERNEILAYLDKKYMKPLRGAYYAKTVLERQAKGIQHYLKQQGFLQASIRLSERVHRAKHTVDLLWRIDLHKRRTFVFFGNKALSQHQLLEAILAFGRSAWIVPATILADELKTAYRARGFLDVVIDARDEEYKSFFVIKEGEQAVIDAIQLNNARHYAPHLLKKRCFPSLKKKSLFDHDQLHRSLDALVDFYLRQGFLDMKIVSHELVPLQGVHHQLVVTIEEGERTALNDLEIPGYPDLEQQPLFARIKRARQPLPYDSAFIDEQKRWLVSHFEKQGYLLVSVKLELKKTEDGTVLVWHIEPGKQVRFGKTIVQGSAPFPFSSIMRELRYREGDVWDQEKIRQSFLRLRNVQLFDTVSFTPISVAEGEMRPVLLKLGKDDPFEVRLRAGFELQHIQQYKTFNGLAYKVGGTFMVKDPFGFGDQLRLDADVARSHRELVLKYQHPWFLKLPIDSTFQIYDTKYEQPGFVGSVNDLYTVYQTGGLMGLRRRVGSVDAGGTIGFEFSETTLDDHAGKLADQLACAINFDPCLLGKRIPFLFMEPSLMIDRLDNNMNPTRGSFSLINLKGMFPVPSQYACSYFIKMLIEQSFFVPVGPAVAAFRFRVGHIFHRLFSEIIPTQRFYLGGSHSIRSYAPDLAPPLGCFINEKGKKCIVPRGGKSMVNLNLELRIPLFKNAAFVLLTDIGALSSDRFADFSREHVAAGTGFGIRYMTPIGPIRFDIAWKWKTMVPHEHRYNWFLTFGQAF